MHKAFGKLVRDNIPEIIKSKGERVTYHVATHDEYRTALHEKLIEEAQEFAQDGSVAELADVMEVVDALVEFYAMDRVALQKTQEDKRVARGGFTKRIILDATD